MRERLDGDTALRLALFSAVIRLAQGRDVRASSATPAGKSLPPAAPASFAEGLLSLQLQHRAALLLVTLERLSYEEAAEVLGISRTFLVAKVSTARQMLARRMEISGDRPVTHLRLVK
jgi:DNA-directed RNA polymerase specialized sigma24 family protein